MGSGDEHSLPVSRCIGLTVATLSDRLTPLRSASVALGTELVADAAQILHE